MPDAAGLLRDFLIILAAAVVVVSVAERLRLGPVLGYLIAGVLIGPAALNLISDFSAAHTLAELGVVFLLFTVGLELPMERLRLMPRAIYVLGFLQIVLSALALAVAGLAFGLAPASAIAVGFSLSLSSTAIVLKLLSDRGELRTRLGRVALGILIMQDLAVAPLLVLLPAIKGSWTDMGASLGMSFILGALATGVILGFGRLALRPLMNAVAATKSPEIFAALTILIVLAAGALTHVFGLSMAFGALLAGMVLADTAYRHQVAAEISPFRGLLLGLFFMTVGMLLDPGQLRSQWREIVAIVPLLLAIKAIIIFALAYGRLLQPSGALRLGFILSQGGEFAFVLLLMARKETLISTDLAQALSVSVIITMMLTPLLAATGRGLAPRLARRAEIGDDALPDMSGEMVSHVVIAGFGRIGQGVARKLDQRGIPWVAIDTDPNLVVAARKSGKPVYYGDADRIEVLEALGLAEAIGVVVAISDQERAIQMVALVHYILPQLPILARAYDEDHAADLIKAGAHEAVPEPSPLSEMITERLMQRIEDARSGPVIRE